MVDAILLDQIQKIRDMTREFARKELRPATAADRPRLLLIDSNLHQYGCLGRLAKTRPTMWPKSL